MIKFWKVAVPPDAPLMLRRKKYWEVTAQFGDVSLHAVLTGPRPKSDPGPTREAAYDSLLRHLVPLGRW